MAQKIFKEKNSMIRSKKFFGMVLVIGLLAFTTTAFADPINGSISFTGTNISLTGDEGPLTLANNTGFNFDSTFATVGLGATGTFSGITPGTVADFSSFTFDPLPEGETLLWSVDYGEATYLFEITSVTIGDRATNYLNLSGSGIASVTGGDWEDTAGQWTLYASQQGASFSFLNSTAQVPEPAYVLLLGLGLGVFSAAALRWKN